MDEHKPASIDETVEQTTHSSPPFVVPRGANYLMGAGFALGLALVAQGNAEENRQLEYFGAGMAAYALIYAASVHFISPLIERLVDRVINRQ